MSGKFAGGSEEIVDMEKEEKVTRDKVENCIKKLLKLAYEEVKKTKPEYIGYPTCDLIACFLDAKDTPRIRFFNIFNQVVPSTYKNKWELFQKEKIEPKSDAILDALSNLGDSIKSDFDEFSRRGVVSNVGLALALLDIYSFDEKIGLTKRGKKEHLVNSTKLLMNNRVPGKGWPYRYTSEGKERFSYSHTLSTWLSMLALNYVPKEIGNAITADWEKTLENIKKEVREWLLGNIHREGNYCSWSFRPGESTEYNPVATAQAILALYQTGIKDKDNNDIKGAIEYIRNNINAMRDEGRPYKTDRLIPEVSYISHISHPGIQHCLHALLMFGVSPEDETIQNLLKETVEMVPKLRATDIDLSNCYAILRPILVYLSRIRPKILWDFATSISEFENFVAGAKSIVIVGEIGDAYAKLIPKDAHVIVLYRKPQEEALLKEHGWDYKWIGRDKTYVSENINCVIVDGKKALLSNDPFKDMGRYTLYKYLEGEEVSDLINQLEEILDINIELKLPKGGMEKEIKEIVREKFPEQAKIMNIEDFESNQLQGILEYYKLNPEQTEEKLAPVLGLKDRKAIESELSRRGIFSRMFINDDLKNLLEKSINERFTRFLVLDESSAYLLLNTRGTDDEDKVIECFSDCLGSVVKLYVTLDTHDELIDFLEGKIESAKLEKITKIDKDERGFSALKQPDKLLYFTKNEKITIAYAAQSEKYGIITNSWEVATMCKVNNIKTFSIMKFLNKVGNDENIYRIFRVPVDEFHR